MMALYSSNCISHILMNTIKIIHYSFSYILLLCPVKNNHTAHYILLPYLHIEFIFHLSHEPYRFYICTELTTAMYVLTPKTQNKTSKERKKCRNQSYLLRTTNRKCQIEIIQACYWHIKILYSTTKVFTIIILKTHAKNVFESLRIQNNTKKYKRGIRDIIV